MWDRRRGKSVKGVLMGSSHCDLRTHCVKHASQLFQQAWGELKYLSVDSHPSPVGGCPRRMTSPAFLVCLTGSLRKLSGQKARQAQEFEVENLLACWKLCCSYQWTRGGLREKALTGSAACPLRLHVQGSYTVLINQIVTFCGHSDWITYSHPFPRRGFSFLTGSRGFSLPYIPFCVIYWLPSNKSPQI